MAEGSQPQLKKTLRVSDGVALLVGITIGSGIYSTPSIIAGYYESFGTIILTWLIVAALVLIGGLIYAELGTRLPETGGEYIYISRCFGPFAGFMFGWAQLFIIRTSPAVGLAIVAADYVGHFTQLSPTANTTVALSIIAALGVFNYVGMEWASLFQKISTATKVVGLVLFAAGGVVLLGRVANQLGTSAATTTGVGTIGNVVAALMLIVFTHTGWDRLGYVAGEIRDPRGREKGRTGLPCSGSSPVCGGFLDSQVTAAYDG